MERERIEDPAIYPPIGSGAGIEVLGWRELLYAIPNTTKLLVRLIRDPRAPALPKILGAAVAVYMTLPIDLIPDFLPILGQLDDAVLLFVALNWLITRTDENVLREHWDGDPATLRAIQNTMGAFGEGITRTVSGLRRSRREYYRSHDSETTAN